MYGRNPKKKKKAPERALRANVPTGTEKVASGRYEDDVSGGRARGLENAGLDHAVMCVPGAGCCETDGGCGAQRARAHGLKYMDGLTSNGRSIERSESALNTNIHDVPKYLHNFKKVSRSSAAKL